MSKESYIRGFCKAAEAHGVDPKGLAKLAYSTPVSEALSSFVPNLAQELILPGSSAVTSNIGYIAGLLADQDNKQKGNGLNFIPGVSRYREGNRIKTQVLRELEYIKKNKLEIKVTTSMSDDDLRDAIREKVNASDEDEDADEDDEDEALSMYAPIVQVCDAISGARPGARREVVEAYIKRLNDLERLALSYPGVVKTYAIQAGRELRVIVGADKISDAETEKLSGEIAKKIQDELTYPGQVRITVIRETRAVSYAK